MFQGHPCQQLWRCMSDRRYLLKRTTSPALYLPRRLRAARCSPGWGTVSGLHGCGKLSIPQYISPSMDNYEATHSTHSICCRTRSCWLSYLDACIAILRDLGCGFPCVSVICSSCRVDRGKSGQAGASEKPGTIAFDVNRLSLSSDPSYITKSNPGVLDKRCIPRRFQSHETKLVPAINIL